MQDIAIYGAGNAGRELACLLRMINKDSPTWNLIGFYDDVHDIGYCNEYGVVLGGINELNAITRPLAVAIANGSPRGLRKIVEGITSPLVEFPNIISPTTVIWDENNITLGRGNIIGMGCSLSCNVKIGNFNLLNGGISLGHDTVIGDFNAIMPCVRISGNVDIGNGNILGTSVIVIEKKSIGNDVTIAPGSVVIRKPKDGNTYIGNPATIVKY
jgi:sugar O-acyltransferase (sialic acid O-acetyltransferase NeuD family)